MDKILDLTEFNFCDLVSAAHVGDYPVKSSSIFDPKASKFLENISSIDTIKALTDDPFYFSYY